LLIKLEEAFTQTECIV